MTQRLALCGLCLLLLILAGPKALAAQELGKAAPTFDLQVLQGLESGNLAESGDQVVIVEFWATYCGWCKATHPKLARFTDKHKGKVVVLGISSQNKKRLVRYLRKHETGLTILHDPKARVSRSYRANATPTLVVIDGNGKVRAWAQGGKQLASILEVAESLIAQ